jgi:hypothetical protein
MHLLGHFSNCPSSLQAVFDALPDEPLEPIELPEPEAETGPLGYGVVQRAVVKVLSAADEPMRRAGIHQAVECLLGHAVSLESVSSCLRKGVRGTDPRFARVARGVYRLAR